MTFLILSLSFISGVLLWDTFYSVLIFIGLFFFKYTGKILIIVFFVLGILQGLYFNYPYIKLSNHVQNHNKIIAYGEVIQKRKNQIVLSVNKISKNYDSKTLKIKFKIAIYSFRKNIFKNIDENDYVKVCLILRTPQYLNPGTFNYKNYLKGKGIHFTSYIKHYNDIIVLKKVRNSNFIANYRNYIKKKILEKNIPAFYKGLIIAISTGDKNFLSKESREFLIKNGISHLFSISGLHVGTFFVFCLILLRIIFLRFNFFYMPFILSIPFTIFYVAFMGGNYPAIRAGLILVFFVLSLFVKRYRDSYDTLGLIFLIIVCLNPYVFYNISFQYSFIVVFFIIFYSKNRVYKSKLRDFFAILVIAFISGIPLSSYYFSKIYIKGLAANIIAVPCFTFIIIPLSLFLILFGSFDIVTSMIINILFLLMKGIKTILDCLGSYKPILIHSFSLFEIIIWYLIIFLTVYMISNIEKFSIRKINKSVLSIVILMITITLYNKISVKNNYLGIIDVPRDEAIFIKGSKKYLISTLNSFKQFDRIILPVLLKKRISNLDYLIVPFVKRNLPDTLEKVVKTLQIKNIVVNDNRICKKQYLKKVNCFNVKENDRVGKIKILYPPNDKYYLLNYKNSSIVMDYKRVFITYNLTKDIFAYLKFKRNNNFKLLVAYNFYMRNAENSLVLNKQRGQGYMEIFPEKDFIIKRFVNNRSIGLLNIIMDRKFTL